MHFHSIAVAGLLVTGVIAAPAPTPHVLHEKRVSIPRAWQKRGKVASSDFLPVRIGLKQVKKNYDYYVNH